MKIRYHLFFFILILIYLVIFSNSFAKQNTKVKYILFKVVDLDSNRPIHSASIAINKCLFLSTSPSGLFKINLYQDELIDFDFLEIDVSKNGYFDFKFNMLIKDILNKPQPIILKLKQKMGTLVGKITGCFILDGEHQFDHYANEQIKVFGKTLSAQHIIYKFTSDENGNFKIFNLPIGTYEIEIRHKTWEVSISKPDEQIMREFNIRNCNNKTYHNNKKDTKIKNDVFEFKNY